MIRFPPNPRRLIEDTDVFTCVTNKSSQPRFFCSVQGKFGHTSSLVLKGPYK